jgi:transglutaminase-like putative cysteine protease
MNPFVDDYRERDDAFGNRVVWFNLRQPHQSLSVTACSLIERTPFPLPDTSPAWESVVDSLTLPLNQALSTPLYEQAETPFDCINSRDFCLPSPHIPYEPLAIDYVRTSFSPGRPILAAMADLSARIHADFAYRPNATQIDTPLTEVLSARHGVCQDFAHLALAGLRGLGLATRYVSGYLRTVPPPGKPRLVGADASHAWFAVYAGTFGWVDFDPTNNLLVDTDHITLAWGRDYSDVAPIRGVVRGSGAGHKLTVSVDVQRVEEAEAAAGVVLQTR